MLGVKIPREIPLRYQALPVALLEVSVTLPPLQNVVGPPAVIDGVGGIALTVTVTASDGALVQAPAGADVTV